MNEKYTSVYIQYKIIKFVYITYKLKKKDLSTSHNKLLHQQ